MEQRWKQVAGFEGVYEVCDTGLIRRVGATKCMKPYVRGGYPSVALKHRGRRSMRAVHTVVLEAFVGPRPLGFHGAHLNGDRNDASLDNLAWVSPSENEAHKRGHGTAATGERSSQAKLTDEQAAIIREIAAAGIAQRKIAALVGISENRLNRIVRRLAYP